MPRDPKLTPGVIDKTLTAAYLCSHKTKLRRKATAKEKRSVYESYGIPKIKRVLYRLDDLIPLSLGGVNTIGNLWPQPLTQSLQKDRMENKLRKEVCAGNMSLQEAQQYFRDNY